MVEKIRCLTVDLPERRREVFVLRYFQGCSFEQIAQLLNCSAGAARAAAFQASKQIRAWAHLRLSIRNDIKPQGS